MSRTSTPILIIGVCALLLSACTASRKAQRRCDRAESRMAKAIYLCPSLLQPGDTLRTAVTVPGDSAQGTAAWSDSLHYDSLLAACQQYAEALAAERELFALSQRPPRTQEAVRTLRQQACEMRPVHVFDGPMELHIWTANGKVEWKYEITPQVVEVSIPSPPRVEFRPAPPGTGVAAWYKWFFWVFVVCFALFLVWMIGGYVNWKRNGAREDEA